MMCKDEELQPDDNFSVDAEYMKLEREIEELRTALKDAIYKNDEGGVKHITLWELYNLNLNTRFVERYAPENTPTFMSGYKGKIGVFRLLEKHVEKKGWESKTLTIPLLTLTHSSSFHDMPEVDLNFDQYIVTDITSTAVLDMLNATLGDAARSGEMSTKEIFAIEAGNG